MTSREHFHRARPRRSLGWGGIACLVLLAAALAPGAALARNARERAVEQIPELMSRILESQEEIRETENELAPIVQRYDTEILSARRSIEGASSEEDAATALVDYVEAYASRLEAQESGLRAIEPSIIRMRADARDLIRAAESVGLPPETPEQRKQFFAGQFQGVAAGTSELASRLGREEEAATAGAVLNASWASHGALQIPLPQLGPEGAVAFARKTEGLFARYQARKNQLVAERVAVRRLLDVMIERQLALRLDELFAGDQGLALGEILSGDGKSADWQDLGNVVSRALGLPSGAGVYSVREDASLERLDFFARGAHRD